MAELSNKYVDGASKVLSSYDGAQKVWNNTKDLYNRYFSYTVSVSEKDTLYNDIHQWLLSIMPEDRHRSLSVSSPRSYSMAVDDSSFYEPEEKTPPLQIKFDDKKSRVVIIDGHRISVMINRPEVSKDDRDPETSRMEFRATTYAGQQAVIKHLNRINAERGTERKPVLRMVGQWGHWKTRSDLPPRTLDSVILPSDQKNRIVDDLSSFLEAEDRYNKLAIPWHRGYMFHGPAGTGKTSLVKALANYFGLDLWYISLSDLKAESSLIGLLSDVGPRSILLLEDIDTIKITHDRDASEQGTISMSSLLNTLDGIATPHGLITMMTTNRFDVLDSALTRAGRMDLIELLDYPSLVEIVNLFDHFYGRNIISNAWYSLTDDTINSVNTAQISEIFKRNMNNPMQAEIELIDMLRI